MDNQNTESAIDTVEAGNLFAALLGDPAETPKAEATPVPGAEEGANVEVEAPAEDAPAETTEEDPEVVVKIDGKEVLVMREEDIMAIVEK